MPLENGKVHIYTGTGKGKTTAALGLALRAIGAGFHVYMIQFMKGNPYSELESIKSLPNFTIKQFGREEFVSKENPASIDRQYAREGFQHAYDIVSQGSHDLVILDEINVAMDYHLITIPEVLSLIENKPHHVEIVLTGRYAPPQVVKIADVVTEMLEIKHPFQNGTLARRGIDY
jgi:cob(I)alamin adenosyltransferase